MMTRTIVVDIPVRVQSPVATLDYGFDWNAGLEPFLASGDSISQSAWTAVQIAGSPQRTAISLSNSAVTGSITTTFVSGGVDGARWRVTCTIATAQGRIDARSLDIDFRTT